MSIHQHFHLYTWLNYYPYLYTSLCIHDHVAHDDVIKWKHFLLCWSFVRGIHRWPVNSPHKCQWRGALMFSLICAWINGWVNSRKAGDLRHHRAHYDVIVMRTHMTRLTYMTRQLGIHVWVCVHDHLFVYAWLNNYVHMINWICIITVWAYIHVYLIMYICIHNFDHMIISLAYDAPHPCPTPNPPPPPTK